MRRWLPLLTVLLLAFAALFAWRLYSPRQHPPASDDLARLLDDLPHVATVEGDVKGRPERQRQTATATDGGRTSRLSSPGGKRAVMVR